MLSNQDKWVLNKLKRVKFDVMIAGDALRNSYLGLPIYIIDIYLYSTDYMVTRYLEINNLVQLLDLDADLDDEVFTYDHPDGATSIPFVKATWNVIKQHIHYKIHFVSCPLAEYFGNCSIGLNKISYDGIKYHHSREFLKDVGNKTISVIHAYDEDDLNTTMQNTVLMIKLSLPQYTVMMDEKKLRIQWEK